MHVLLLAPGFSVHSRRFVHMLLDAGHSVTLVDTLDPFPQGLTEYAFIPYPGLYGLGKSGSRITNRLGHWFVPALLRLIWQRVKPDVVHVQWVDERATYCAQARLRPLILSCWGSDINDLFAPGHTDERQRRRIAKAVAAANHVTADSPEVLERCETLVGHELPTSLFYFGIDLGTFKPGYSQEAQASRQKLGISPNASVILSPRTLRPLMGHHHILEAFAQIAHEPSVPEAVLVIKRFLPSDAGYENALRQQAAALGVEDRLYWLDEVPNDTMPVHYALSDVIVNYPEQDGFPVTFFEAAACKRTVISADLPAYRGVFGPEDFELVPPGNPVELAGALRAILIEDPARTQQRIEHAFSRVQQIGERSACFKVIENIYQEVAATS